MIAPPSSRHQGGVHILMADGAVIFVSDSIEAGDPRAGMVWRNGQGPQSPGSQSPYGLWGSLGTKASKEVIEEQLTTVMCEAERVVNDRQLTKATDDATDEEALTPSTLL